MRTGLSTHAYVLCVVNNVLHSEINLLSSYPTQEHDIRQYISHFECAAAIHLGREGPYPRRILYPVPPGYAGAQAGKGDRAVSAMRSITYLNQVIHC
jgi:hypothetical protein